MRTAVAAMVLLSLTACAGIPTGPVLVSTQYPPGTGQVNAHAPAQTLNSLPPGAANYSPAPGGTWPDYGAVTFRAF